MAEKESVIDTEKQLTENRLIQSIFGTLDSYSFENLTDIRRSSNTPATESLSILPGTPLPPLAPGQSVRKPGSPEYGIVLTLSIVAAIVSLDTTIFFAVLPVSQQLLNLEHSYYQTLECS